MGFDLRRSFGAKSVIWSTVQELYEKVLGRQGDNVLAWEVQRFGKDFAVHLVSVLVVVRW